MNRVTVVGLGLGRADLTPRGLAAIESAQVLAGGERLLAWFPEHPGPKLPLKYNLADWLERVAAAADQGQGVAVLASGDPGFYGVAAKVIERLGREAVTVLPNVTAMSAACARLGLAWQEARAVSLHGRDDQGPLWRALGEADLVVAYTDPKHGPAWLAGRLIERGQAGYWRLGVAQDLGAEGERVGWFTPEQATGESFSELNLVVLERVARPRTLRLGAPEKAYAHQAGLITKAEVRCVALGLLELGPGLTVWDLGAGSGSVSLEAGLICSGGRVVAVEADPERVALIQANRARFGAGWLEVRQARLPEGLAELPAPDRVFIGGGGDELGAIIQAAWERLKPGGVLLASLVRLESLARARDALAGLGAAVTTTQIQIGRGAALTGGEYLKALNPVWLVRGRREENS